MSVPVCRECDACRLSPVYDKTTGSKAWAFDCETSQNRIGIEVGKSDALPKTSPRWCPLRAKNLPDPMRREDGE